MGKTLMQGLSTLLQYRITTDGMQVVRVENRFNAPTPLGWRDVSLLLKVAVPGDEDEEERPKNFNLASKSKTQGFDSLTQSMGLGVVGDFKNAFSFGNSGS